MTGVPMVVHSRLETGEALVEPARGSRGRLGRESGIHRVGLLCFRCVRRPRTDRTGKSPQAGADCMSRTGEAGKSGVQRRVESGAVLGIPAMILVQELLGARAVLGARSVLGAWSGLVAHRVEGLSLPWLLAAGKICLSTTGATVTCLSTGVEVRLVVQGIGAGHTRVETEGLRVCP